MLASLKSARRFGVVFVPQDKGEGRGSAGRDFASHRPVLVAILGFGGSAISQIARCQSSRKCIELTRAQVLCINKKIDRLLERPTDPVYFDAGGCGDQGDKLGPGVPHIPVIPNTDGQQSPNTSNAKWLRLSKFQLECLNKILPSLISSGTDPVTVELGEAGCP